MTRILNCEPVGYSDKARNLLKDIGTLTEKDLKRGELLRAIPNHEVLIVRLRHQIDEEVLDAANTLKVIVTATTGLDHIDVSRAESQGIAVLSLQGETRFLETVHATAEHTWALLLALLRHVPQAFEAVKKGEWDRDKYRGGELAQKRLGLVGMGRLGRRVAGYGLAFGMKVGGYDPYAKKWFEHVNKVSSLQRLFEIHDIVSLHLPLKSETRGIVGSAELESMVPGAILVNTSRGEILQTRALLAALDSGQLGGAAIDVVPAERDRETEEFSMLVEYARSHDNLLITPHIAGATQESMESTEIFMAEKLIQFLKLQNSE